ncbi:MAG: tetratricopeptide repeat protein [Proteobacteria bacterium]|nr:tetratricopeptide repeat protein [Pseudomonadota bacterium]MBU0968839.1 tetratricopeptide repeat protein [Pseudomonadota bacterium]
MKDLRLHNQDQKQDDKSQARLDYEEGLEFLKNKETAQAANMFHNALIGFEQEKDINGIANATDKLGDICAERRELDKAMQLYDRVISICQDQGDSISVFSIDKKKAKLHADCGKYEKAISMYLDIIDQYNAMRNPQGTVDTLETLAQVYLDAGKREKAADCLQTAAAIHEKYKHRKHAEDFMKRAEELVAPA